MFVLGAIACLSACSSLSIDSEWDHKADFSTYHSFAWIPQEKGLPAEQQLPKHLDMRLRRVVEEILIDDKGFDKAMSPADADLLIAYYIDTEKNLTVDYSVYGGYYGGYGYGYWPGYWGGAGPGYYEGAAAHHVREYTTGTLVLDIVDAKTKTLVWTGVIAGEARHHNPSGERITQIMHEMLKSFPPGSGS